MHTIGIDMSKDTFHAAFDEETVRIFQNTIAGIKEFINALGELGCTKENTVIGTESTGVYHLLFCEQLRSQGWKVRVLNPLITSRMFKSTVRYAKTDRTDALAIRKAVLTGAGYFYTDTPEIQALKALVQEREALCRMKAETKQRIHAHLIREKAAGLDLYDSFTGTIKILAYEMKEIEKKMKNYASDTQKLLRSIPGIGKVTAAALVAYIGDINRFESPEKLVAYIGLDCRVHESGTSIHGKGYLTKRGNRYLRYILFNAAFIARKKNPAMRAYFEKKMSEGKHYFSALCAVERKLVHLIYAVWKRRTPFEVR
jgi:transposase